MYGNEAGMANSTFAPSGLQTPKRAPQIENQLTRAQGNLELLQKEVAALEQRLSGVLRPIVPTPESIGKEAQQLCPLADVLNRLADGIYHVTGHVTQIMERIEL